MKKLVSLLLAVLLFAGVLCACKKEEPEAPTVVLFGEGSSEWSVVYNMNDHFRATGAAYSFRRFVKAGVGYYPTLAKDASSAPSSDAKEVLVGNTNRPESAQALQGLADNEYIITFDGTKLVINAKDPYGVRYAVRTFFAEHPGEVALKTDFVKKGTFTVPNTVTVVDSMKRGFNVYADGYKPQGQQEYMFTALKEGGFDHVRLPLNLSLCFDENGEPVFEQVAYIDNAVNWALENGFVTLLDFHGWKGVSTYYPEERNIDLFVKIWEYFTERYKEYPDNLCFELLNEPNNTGEETWDAIEVRAYNAVRAIDEDRIIFLSPCPWNGTDAGSSITIPYEDDAVAIDMHNYSPGKFTHQGVDDRLTDIAYTANVFTEWSAELDKVVQRRRSSGIQVIVGEFGVTGNAEDEDEAAFLSDVTARMEEMNVGWTLWEFPGIKALYHKDDGTWHTAHMQAIMTHKYLKYNK